MFSYLSQSCRQIPAYVSAQRRCQTIASMGGVSSVANQCRNLSNQYEGADNDNVRININNASVDELTFLSGVNSTIATEIINYRQTNPFTSVNSLINVSGITPYTVERIVDQGIATITGETSLLGDPLINLTEAEIYMAENICPLAVTVETTFDLCRNAGNNEDLILACYETLRYLEKGNEYLACASAAEERGKSGLIDAIATEGCVDFADPAGSNNVLSDLHPNVNPKICTDIHEDKNTPSGGGVYYDFQTMIEDECFDVTKVINRIKEDCRYLWKEYTETWMWVELFREMYKAKVLIRAEESHAEWLCFMNYLDNYRITLGPNFFQRWINEPWKVFFPSDVCGSGTALMNSLRWYRTNFSRMQSDLETYHLMYGCESEEPGCIPNEWRTRFYDEVWLTSYGTMTYSPTSPWYNYWDYDYWWEVFHRREGYLSLSEMLKEIWYEHPIEVPQYTYIHYHLGDSEADEPAENYFLQNVVDFREFVYYITDPRDLILVFDFINDEEVWHEFLLHLNDRDNYSYLSNSVSVELNQEVGLFVFYEFFKSLNDENGVNLLDKFYAFMDTSPDLKKILLPPKICQEIGVDDPDVIEEIDMLNEEWQEYVMREQLLADFYAEFWHELKSRKYKVRGGSAEDLLLEEMLTLSEVITFVNSYAVFTFLWDNGLAGDNFREIPDSLAGTSPPISVERCMDEGGTEATCEATSFNYETYRDEIDYFFDIFESGSSTVSHDDGKIYRFQHFTENYGNFIEYSYATEMWGEYPELLMDLNLFNSFSNYANNWSDYERFLTENSLWVAFNNYSASNNLQNDFGSFLQSNSTYFNRFSSWIEADDNPELFHSLFVFLRSRGELDSLERFLNQKDELKIYKWLEFLGRHESISNLVNIYTHEIIVCIPSIPNCDLTNPLHTTTSVEIVPVPLYSWYRHYSANIERHLEDIHPYETEPPFLPFSENISPQVKSHVCAVLVRDLGTTIPDTFTTLARELEVSGNFNEMCDYAWDSFRDYIDAIASSIDQEIRREMARDPRLASLGTKELIRRFVEFLTLNNLLEEFIWEADGWWYYLAVHDSLEFLILRGLFEKFVAYANMSPSVIESYYKFRFPPQIKPFTRWLVGNMLMYRVTEDTMTISSADRNKHIGPYEEFWELHLKYDDYAHVDPNFAYDESQIWDLLYERVKKDTRWTLYRWFHTRLVIELYGIYRRLGMCEYRSNLFCGFGGTTIHEFRKVELLVRKTRTGPPRAEDFWKTGATAYAGLNIVGMFFGPVMPVILMLYDYMNNLPIIGQILSWFQRRDLVFHGRQNAFDQIMAILERLIPARTEDYAKKRTCENLFLSVGEAPSASCQSSPISTMENKCTLILEEEIENKREDFRRANFPHHCAILAILNEGGANATLLSEGYESTIGGDPINLELYMASDPDGTTTSYPRQSFLGCSSPSLNAPSIPDDININIPMIPLSRFSVQFKDIITPDFIFMPFFSIKLPNFYIEDLTFPDIEICNLNDCQNLLNLFPSIFDMYPHLGNIHIPLPDVPIDPINLNDVTISTDTYGTLTIPVPQIRIDPIKIPSLTFYMPQLVDVNVFSFINPIYQLPDPRDIEIEEPEITFTFKGIDMDVLGVLIAVILDYFGLSVPSASVCISTNISGIFIPLIVHFSDYYISWPDFPKVPELPFCRNVNDFCRNAKGNLENLIDAFHEFIEELEINLDEVFTLPAEAAENLEKIINSKIKNLENEINAWLVSETHETEILGEVLRIKPISIPLEDIYIEFYLSDLYGMYFEERTPQQRESIIENILNNLSAEVDIVVVENKLLEITQKEEEVVQWIKEKEAELNEAIQLESSEDAQRIIEEIKNEEYAVSEYIEEEMSTLPTLLNSTDAAAHIMGGLEEAVKKINWYSEKIDEAVGGGLNINADALTILSEISIGTYPQKIVLDLLNLDVMLDDPIIIEIPNIPLSYFDFSYDVNINLPGFQAVEYDVSIETSSTCRAGNYTGGLPFDFDVDISDIFSEEKNKIKDALRSILPTAR